MNTARIVLSLSLACGLAACESTEDPYAGTGPTPRDTGDRDTGTADVGGQDTVAADTTQDTAAPIGDCPTDVVFTGQVFVGDNPAPLSPNGGAPRFEAWDSSYDAGIGAIADAAPTSGDPITGEWQITDATVIATDYNSENTQRAQRSFWLADGNAAVQVFFFAEDTDSQPELSIKVGQRISGTATSLGSYQTMPQISTANGSAWTLNSEGNEVYIEDVVTGPLTADQAHHVVRVTGYLESLESADCGGAQCFEMVYGDNHSVTLRTTSEFVDVGTCVTYVGPVRLFSGQPQLDTQNFDWLWTYDD